MLRQARISDPIDFHSATQPRCQQRRAGRGALHAQRQGSQPAQHEPAVERAGDGARDVLDVAEAFGQRRIADDHRPAHQVVVAVEVFGGALHHDVRAQLQRALEIG